MRVSVHSALIKALSVVMTGVLLQVCGLAQVDDVPAEIALAEKTAALDAAIDRINNLQKQLTAAEAKAAALTEGLATANAESVQFSEAYQNLRLKVEALGPALLEKGNSGIEAKLLSAVSDLGIVRKENERLADQLVTVTEAVMALLSSTDESRTAELRANVEKELRSADQLLGFRMDGGQEKARLLEAARVVSLKKEWGLIVLNSGATSGVKIGTPLEIIRADRAVATATIVNIRDTISGAILTSPAAEENPVRIGDGVRLAVAQNLQN